MDINQFTSSILAIWNKLNVHELKTDVVSQLSDVVHINNGPYKHCKNLPGIYCFSYVGESLDFGEFNQRYSNSSNNDYKTSKAYPNCYQDAIENKSIILNNLKEAKCFYIGKNEKVKSRIIQHIGENGGSKSTYGLHLNRLKESQRELYNSLYVGCYHLPPEVIEQLTGNGSHGKYITQQLITYLETELRKELSPMVGKQ